MSKQALVSCPSFWVAHIKISVYLAEVWWRNPADGAPPGGVTCGGRANPAAARRPLRPRRAHSQRTDADPRAEPATRVASSEAPMRSRPSRPLPRGELGILSPEPIG